MSEHERGTPSSPAEVERQIGHTRGELAMTLNAIEDRLAPRHLVEKGFDMVKDNFTGGDAINRGFAVVRANPVPFALFGIGAAWLIAENTGLSDRLAQNQRIEATRRRVAELASGAGAMASDMAVKVGIGGSSSTNEPLGRTGNPVVDQQSRGQADGWVHQVTDMAQGALRSVRDSGNAALNRAGGYAGDGAGRVADQLSDTLERHPLLLGAIGVMAGALLASLLPLSRTEEDWIGGARDEFWQRAEKAGQQAVTQVRDAAANAASRAVDAAASATSESLRNETVGGRADH